MCLPELFRTPYFCQQEDPVFERRAAGLYHNSAAILDASGETVGLYRKMHTPDDPLFYEKFYFTPGDLGCARRAPPPRPGRRSCSNRRVSGTRVTCPPASRV